MSITRRDFVRSVLGTASAVCLPMFVPQSVFAKGGANNRIRIGTIGCGRRGQEILSFDVGGDWRTVCDCFRQRADKMAAKYEKPVAYDYREVLDDKNIDAVYIATPDHWHARMTILACQAGKDVYIEKPLALTIHEGQAMMAARKKYDRVLQMGTSARSFAANIVGCEIVRSGRMGKVNHIVCQNFWGSCAEKLPEQPVPAGLNWDMFVGQARFTPFHRQYMFPEDYPDWSGFWQFGNAAMTGDGAHAFDQVLWALGDPRPVAVQKMSEGTGGPDSLARDAHVKWWFDNGITMRTMENVKTLYGAQFLCERGQINIDRGRFNIMPADLRREIMAEHRGLHMAADDGHDDQGQCDHFNNFLDCIISRGKPNATVRMGHRATLIGHMAAIVRIVGGKLTWDPKLERFDRAEANQYLDRARRKGYELPKV